jgi:S-adenosylmethionine-dependent methyltransferase
MKENTANADIDRFQSGADTYASYLQTPEGRLRLDLAFSNLQEFLPQATRPLRALDVGGGTGAVALRLARLGIYVTLMDASAPMLDQAERAAREAEVVERIALKHGDATQVANFDAGSFDLILCHNSLEYFDDPATVLHGAARLMRDSSSILSVLVRNRSGEVLKFALQAGDLATAEKNLDAEWGEEALYGGPVRLFTPETLQAMLQAASFEVVATRGVRVFSDYLPSKIDRSAEYDKIFELERKLGARPDFAAVARYTHCLARRQDSSGA